MRPEATSFYFANDVLGGRRIPSSKHPSGVEPPIRTDVH